MSRGSEKFGESDVVTGADVTRQAELVVLEYLKSWKCTQTLDQVMAKSKTRNPSLMASELYATDLDSKKKASQEYTSVLEFMVSVSSRSVIESRASDSEEGSASRSGRRRSSVNSDTSKDIGEAVWSKEDISKLKKAIKETSAVEDKNDRWREIAALVGNGKSKKHCYMKYKELKDGKKSSSSKGSSASSSDRRSSVDRSAKTVKSSEGEADTVDKSSKGETPGFSALKKPVREEDANPPSTVRPRSSIGNELQMEDVDEFDMVAPAVSRSNNMSIASSGASQIATKSMSVRVGGSRAPTADEVASLQSVLFADGKKGFSSHWEEQVWNMQQHAGFFYSDVANLRYGLVQREGGPCGVLAVVQAYVLRFLLELAPRDWQNPDRSQQDRAIVSALAHILHQASGGAKTPCLVALNERSDRHNAGAKRKFLSGVVLHTSPNEEDTRTLLMRHLAQLAERKGNGLVLFVLSVLLSKGVANIRSEMDQIEGMLGDGNNSGGKLIGGHDYCTQEMVNLLICGQACSNVFNGTQLLEGTSEDDPNAVVLKGIPAQATIGFLSLFEAYEYMVVGSHLKTPKFNLWVVCSESHYSVLFTDPKHLGNARLDELRILDLYYYDGLANQDEVIRLSIDAFALDEKATAKHDDLTPPLNLVIQTKWPLATVDWNDVEPLL